MPRANSQLMLAQNVMLRGISVHLAAALAEALPQRARRSDVCVGTLPTFLRKSSSVQPANMKRSNKHSQSLLKSKRTSPKCLPANDPSQNSFRVFPGGQTSKTTHGKKQQEDAKQVPATGLPKPNRRKLHHLGSCGEHRGPYLARQAERSAAGGRVAPVSLPAPRRPGLTTDSGLGEAKVFSPPTIFSSGGMAPYQKQNLHIWEAGTFLVGQLENPAPLNHLKPQLALVTATILASCLTMR